MARTVGIGIQDFDTLISNGYFYVDKTGFIKEWWESGDSVTLITRPRRFGKTLAMNMVESFFSVNYAGRKDLFEGLSIWKDEKYRDLQGTYPVVSLSFAEVKEKNCEAAKEKIRQIIADLYRQHRFLRNSRAMEKADVDVFDMVSSGMGESVAAMAIKRLSEFLYRHYGKKVIILLDEYDTPMQEAYVGGYWDEFADFTRGLFNSTFKTNPWLERAIMTGITRVSKESVFSDLNNLKAVTTTSGEYADAFGFTEREVFDAMDEMGLPDKEKVKLWYDGFTFGNVRDIYNPWSIINYLDSRRFDTYWASTSSNGLVGKLIREAGADIKKSFEQLLAGNVIKTEIDEQIVYSQLDSSRNAIWSFLLAGGYLKVVKAESFDDVAWWEGKRPLYELVLTNFEVRYMFESLVRDWFGAVASDYNDFVHALLVGDVDAMNEYMNRISEDIFSSFDTASKGRGRTEPERFYHGFVLGLTVELKDRYVITSNRESGFGRYDVAFKPKEADYDAIIVEFKVFDKRRDKTLDDTLCAALRQIEENNYAAGLEAEGIPIERIRKYGFAFKGKRVLVGGK